MQQELTRPKGYWTTPLPGPKTPKLTVVMLTTSDPRFNVECRIELNRKSGRFDIRIFFNRLEAHGAIVNSEMVDGADDFGTFENVLVYLYEHPIKGLYQKVYDSYYKQYATPV